MTIEGRPTLTSSDFGGLLRYYRQAAGLSQEALAERARMSVDGVSALERGSRRTPRFGTLSLLIEALALSPGDKRRLLSAVAPLDRPLRSPQNYPEDVSEKAVPVEVQPFGALLRRYRLQAGLSQEELGERASMSARGIGALERGYRRNPQRETIALLAAALALDENRRTTFELAARGRRGPYGYGETPELPVSLTTFIGRHAELLDIARLLQGHRLVTIVGAGGMGKTRAGIEGARAARLRAAISFITFAPLASGDLVPSAIAACLGVQESPNISLTETIVRHLRNRPALLIFDNCEHVIAAAALVAEALLAGCPELRILTTSREALRVPGEHRYTLESLSATDASLLFLDRAQSADHRFTLDDRKKPIVAEICRQLDGIPLAIEMAAARTSFLSVQSVKSMLAQRFELLAGSERAGVARHRTMRATIDWSYELLSQQEQKLFNRLSVFAGPCTIDIVMAVCSGGDIAEEDLPELLVALAEKSMVSIDVTSKEHRYGLLESFRSYASEKLEAEMEVRALSLRHAHVFLQVAERLSIAYNTSSSSRFRDSAGLEMTNWLRALQFTLHDSFDVGLGQRLASALTRVWLSLAPLDGRRWLALARSRIDQGTSPTTVAAIAVAEMTLLSWLDEYEGQFIAAEEAHELCSRLNDEAGMTLARCNRLRASVILGLPLDFAGEPAELVRLARRLFTGKRLSYVFRIASTLSNYGGYFEVAKTYLAEASAVASACNDEIEFAVIAQERVECELLSGNGERAFQYVKEMLDYARESSRFESAYFLTYAAKYLTALERYELALGAAVEALDDALDLGNDILVVKALYSIAVGAAASDWDSSARILGFVYKRNPSTFAQPFQKKSYTKATALFRENIGVRRFEALFQEGYALTQERAVALAKALAALD